MITVGYSHNDYEIEIDSELTELEVEILTKSLSELFPNFHIAFGKKRVIDSTLVLKNIDIIKYTILYDVLSGGKTIAITDTLESAKTLSALSNGKFVEFFSVQIDNENHFIQNLCALNEVYGCNGKGFYISDIMAIFLYAIMFEYVRKHKLPYEVTLHNKQDDTRLSMRLLFRYITVKERYK